MTTPAKKKSVGEILRANAKNFAIGGLSGMLATLVIQPIDMVKVRIQLKSEAGAKNLNPFSIAKEIIADSGVSSLYKGIDSALLRQATYTTARLGLYFTLFDHMKANKKPGENLSMLEKSEISLFAGGFGALFGNPADLALIRMQADGTLPVAERRNYKHVGDALTRIVKEEGVISLWKGSTPTVVRAMAVNLGMLGPFDEAKERLSKHFGPESYTTKLGASAIAGFLAAFICLPFDNIKTKLQKMKKAPDGTLPYKGIIDCAKKTVAREGVTGFWAGFPTFYVRIAPHAMIVLLSSDYLRKYFK